MIERLEIEARLVAPVAHRYVFGRTLARGHALIRKVRQLQERMLQRRLHVPQLRLEGFQAARDLAHRRDALLARCARQLRDLPRGAILLSAEAFDLLHHLAPPPVNLQDAVDQRRVALLLADARLDELRVVADQFEI